MSDKTSFIIVCMPGRLHFKQKFGKNSHVQVLLVESIDLFHK